MKKQMLNAKPLICSEEIISWIENSEANLKTEEAIVLLLRFVSDVECTPLWLREHHSVLRQIFAGRNLHHPNFVPLFTASIEALQVQGVTVANIDIVRNMALKQLI